MSQKPTLPIKPTLPQEQPLPQEPASSTSWLSTLWDRLIAVDHPDSDLARLGRLFNILLLSSLLVGLLAAGIFLVMDRLQYVGRPWVWIMAASPSLFVPLSILCIARVKRGHIRDTIRFYLWALFLGILAACLIFDGITSPGWILFFWAIALAGTLTKPVYALRLSAALLGTYLLLLVLTRAGLYTPFFILTPQARTFNVMAFLFLVLLALGYLIYLTMDSLGRTFDSLRAATQALQEGRQLLETRVQERTAEVTRRAEQFQAVAELTRAIAGIMDLDPLLETSVHLISERLGFYHTSVFLLDDAAEWAILRASSSEGGQQMAARGHRLQIGSSTIVGSVASTSRARIALDIGEDAAWFDDPDLPGTRSEMALPLIARGDLIGVLDIQSGKVSAFSDDDLQVLRVLADGLAVAIENTRLLDQTRKAAARLAQYQEEDTLRGWRKALTRRNLQLDYLYDRVTVTPTAAESTPIPAAAQGLRELQVVVQDGRHLMLAPIQVQNRTVGVLSFESPHPWAEDAQQLAKQVVGQLGLALENARLLEDTRLSALQERARSEIVSRVRASVQVDAILRSAAEELGRALQVERARIQLIPTSEQEPPDHVD